MRERAPQQARGPPTPLWPSTLVSRLVVHSLTRDAQPQQPKMGDYPKATAVFDLDSVGLLKLIKGLNGGVDPAGRDFGGQARFFCATGAEPGAVDYEREMKRLRDKIEAGAEMVMTQPVYCRKVMRKFLDDVAALPRPVPVLMGLCPLVSSRNAEFLHHEVPGMSVPQPIRERMAAAGGGPAGIAEGVKIAKEMLNEFKSEVVGCYIMPQLGKYEAAVAVLEVAPPHPPNPPASASPPPTCTTFP